MRKKTEITEDEKAEFRQVTRGVKPLIHSKVEAKPPAPKPKRRQPEPETPSTFAFSDFETLDSVTGEEKIEFARPGIQHKVLRNLRLGQYNVNAILDLHGMTVALAQHALSDFLTACQQQDIRHVLIIHGKGRDPDKPILKNKLNHWLRQTEQVLAFCSATKHGRGGALYVLLKGRK
jgi:DNA-nicking Smr family endonuclease